MDFSANVSGRFTRSFSLITMCVIAASWATGGAAMPVYAADNSATVGSEGGFNFYSWFLDRENAQSEVQLLHVTSDAEAGFQDIKLVLNESGDVVSFRQYNEKGLQSEFSMASLDKGVVLMQSGGHEVVKLMSHEVNGRSGGAIDMIYLTTESLIATPRFRWICIVREEIRDQDRQPEDIRSSPRCS